MDDDTPQPPQRERIGARAWVRTAGLVGGGLVAGGILAATLTANAATDESTTAVPSHSQDCPDGAAGSRGPGTTEEGTGGTPSTEGSSADGTA
jgi:hypothetical protein